MRNRDTRLLRLSASMLAPLLCAAQPATTVVRKPPIAWLTNPQAPQLQRVSAISPLRFEPNVGQAGPEVRYIARGAGYILMLAGQEAVMVLPSGSSSPAGKSPSATGRMKVGGAASTSSSQPDNLLASVAQYYIG